MSDFTVRSTDQTLLLPVYPARDREDAIRAGWEFIRRTGHNADVFESEKKIATVAVTWHDKPVDKAALLAQLIGAGVTLSECIKAFSERQDDTAKAYVEQARGQWVKEGSIEIDDFSIASGSEDRGDYVLAWVWVADEDQDEDGEHVDGDGCAIYDTGYQVHFDGDLSTTKAVEDLEVGETYNDPANDAGEIWWTVVEVEAVGDDVHVLSTED